MRIRSDLSAMACKLQGIGSTVSSPSCRTEDLQDKNTSSHVSPAISRHFYEYRHPQKGRQFRHERPQQQQNREIRNDFLRHCTHDGDMPARTTHVHMSAHTTLT